VLRICPKPVRSLPLVYIKQCNCIMLEARDTNVFLYVSRLLVETCNYSNSTIYIRKSVSVYWPLSLTYALLSLHICLRCNTHTHTQQVVYGSQIISVSRGTTHKLSKLSSLPSAHTAMEHIRTLGTPSQNRSFATQVTKLVQLVISLLQYLPFEVGVVFAPVLNSRAAGASRFRN
jgi:hypothetical protein